MQILFEKFLPGEILHIRDSRHGDAAYTFGTLVRSVVKRRLNGYVPDTSSRDHEIADAGLATIRRLRADPTWDIDGINPFARYLERLEGYARGACVDLATAAHLAMEIVPACQTVMNHDTVTGRIAVMHTEENFDDQDLFAANGLFESGNDAGVDDIPYSYRMVEWQDATTDVVFFGYPGLSFGGHAMGYNRRTGLFMAVNTLPVKEQTERPAKDMLWINALGSIFFDLGTYGRIRAFARRFRSSGIVLQGSYAFHFAWDSGRARLRSYEAGRDQLAMLRPVVCTRHEIVGQSNYPRAACLRGYTTEKGLGPILSDIDLYRIQNALLARRRSARLRKHAVKLTPELETAIVMEMMRNVLRDPKGDVESAKGLKMFSGMMTLYLAGYAMGVIGSGGQLTFAKYGMEPDPNHPFRRVYREDDPVSKKNTLCDLQAYAVRRYGKGNG